VDNSPSITGRPTWAEIDLDALANNYRVIRNQVGDDVKILAAVKANAYGHGAVECARRLEREGADWFGVALPEEGIELRSAAVTKPILCLGGFWPGQEGALLRERLTPVVYRLDMIGLLNRSARDAGLTADVHVKIDTGMGRLGVRADQLTDFCAELRRFQNIRVAGLMTHLAVADDDAKKDFTEGQLRKFDEAVAVFRQHGFSPVLIHAANSAATFARPRSGENMVRPGGTLYGFVGDVLPASVAKPRLRPVMSVHSRIILLKTVPRGEKLGYGATFETQRDSVIATLPIGYDDGYRRALSNKGRAIVRGQFVPVVGRVSMDLTLIDVTDVADAALEDEVVLLGGSGGLNIVAEDLGAAIGTISYEVTCGISNRVPRIYR
jgi:alanine racemase